MNQAMDEYQVDISADEVLTWVRADALRKTPRLLVRAAKEFRGETDFDREDAGFGDDEELSLATVTGTLTVAPRRGRGGWELQVRCEDSAGMVRPGATEDDAEEDDENLPLDAFVAQFLARPNEDAEVSVLAEDAAAWRRFRKWLARQIAAPRK